MIQVYPVLPGAKRQLWEQFAPYHYLTANLNASASCWVAAWGDDLVAFTSALAMPSGTMTDAWREHRTVVLPDYQGLGLGAVLSDWLGQHHLDKGKHLYSRTTHPRLARYRRESGLWRETKKSGKQRKPGWNAWTNTADGKTPMVYDDDRVRLAYSFEYVGPGGVASVPSRGGGARRHPRQPAVGDDDGLGQDSGGRPHDPPAAT